MSAQSETGQTQDERAFVDSFDALARAVRRARGMQPRSDTHALTLSQFALLEALADREHARVAVLAEEAGVTASTATRILDALERRGIVARRRDPEDRRGVEVVLSPDGRALLTAQEEWVSARKRAFVAALSEQERALAPELIRGLAQLIDELAAGPE